MQRLQNKVAIIAGSATSIGAACAKRYVAEGGHANLTKAGYEPAFHGLMPGGECCTLFDTRSDSGGFVEIMDRSPFIVAQINHMATAHEGCDGHTRPVRPMTESFS